MWEATWPISIVPLNPLITVTQIPDAGHGLPFDQPERLAAAVIAFLHQLPPASERH